MQIGDDATALLFPALHDITGGVEDIVTERDLRARREAAQRADIDALTEARAQAGDLDNQLARAEAAAARAFAAGPARGLRPGRRTAGAAGRNRLAGRRWGAQPRRHVPGARPGDRGP